MTVTPFRVIAAINAVAVLSVLFIGYGSGDPNGKAMALLGPFVIAALDLCAGIICVVLMGVFALFNKGAQALADKCMQAFMICFGVVLCISVPACFAGLGLK